MNTIRCFRFLTVTDLTRCSSRGYRKKYTFCYEHAECSSIKGIITTLHPLSKFGADEFVFEGSLSAEVQFLCDTWSLMNEEFKVWDFQNTQISKQSQVKD